MHKLYELKDNLMDELEEIAGKGRLSMDDLTKVKYLSSSLDHICNVLEKGDEDDYSSRMNYPDNRSYGDGGYSNARGRGRNARRDSMGRYSGDGGYSRDDGKRDIMRHLESALNAAQDDETRRKIERLIAGMENA